MRFLLPLLIASVNLLAVLVGRLVVTRIAGLRGAGIRPLFPAYLGSERHKPPVSRWLQTLQVAGAFAVAYLLAAGLFAAAFKLGGRVSSLGDDAPALVDVVPGRAAAEAGLRDGDRVVALAGEPVKRWSDLAAGVRRHAGETVAVEVERDGQRTKLDVLVPQEGRLGVQLRPERSPVGWFQAGWLGARQPVVVGVAVLEGLASLVTGREKVELAGPAAIIAAGTRAAPPGYLPALCGALQTYYGLPLALFFGFFARFRRFGKPVEA